MLIPLSAYNGLFNANLAVFDCAVNAVIKIWDGGRGEDLKEDEEDEEEEI